jgi:hypothetical protein
MKFAPWPDRSSSLPDTASTPAPGEYRRITLLWAVRRSMYLTESTYCRGARLAANLDLYGPSRDIEPTIERSVEPNMKVQFLPKINDEWHIASFIKPKRGQLVQKSSVPYHPCSDRVLSPPSINSLTGHRALTVDQLLSIFNLISSGSSTKCRAPGTSRHIEHR